MGSPAKTSGLVQSQLPLCPEHKHTIQDRNYTDKSMPFGVMGRWASIVLYCFTSDRITCNCNCVTCHPLDVMFVILAYQAGQPGLPEQCLS